VAIRTIIWSDDAFLELQNTIAFLEENWTDREVIKLDKELAHTLLLISNNPYLFNASKDQISVKQSF
jgi:plasmid stabilization system protein ParE